MLPFCRMTLKKSKSTCSGRLSIRRRFSESSTTMRVLMMATSWKNRGMSLKKKPEASKILLSRPRGALQPFLILTPTVLEPISTTATTSETNGEVHMVSVCLPTAAAALDTHHPTCHDCSIPRILEGSDSLEAPTANAALGVLDVEVEASLVAQARTANPLALSSSSKSMILPIPRTIRKVVSSRSFSTVQPMSHPSACSTSTRHLPRFM